MSKKKKDPVIKDYEKLKNEVVIDKVNEIFRTQPDNYIAALEEIGFEYHEEDDYEEIEERNARPENQNQKDLVAFFKGKKKLFDPDYARFLLCLALKRKTDIVITQFKA